MMVVFNPSWVSCIYPYFLYQIPTWRISKGVEWSASTNECVYRESTDKMKCYHFFFWLLSFFILFYDKKEQTMEETRVDVPEGFDFETYINNYEGKAGI